MEKGIADQWIVKAFSPSSGTAVTGATITATLFKDGATSGSATTDTNPTELSNGFYQFSMNSAENDVTRQQLLVPVTTTGAEVIAYPNPRFPRPENFSVLGLSSGGGVTNVALVDTCTVNSDMVGEPLTSAQTGTISAAALSDIHLDHIFAVNYNPTAQPGTSTALFNELVESNGSGVSRFTQTALEQAPVGTGSTFPTVADIADGVWDEAKSGHVAAGSFGEEVQSHSLSSEISALNDFDPSNDTVTTVTNVTNEVTANVTKWAGTATSSGDAAISTMRGTDNAALASVCTEGRLSELDAGNMPSDLSRIETDTQDIQSRIPASLSSGRMVSDSVAISGSTAAADATEANISNLDVTVSSRSTLTTAETKASATVALTDYDAAKGSDVTAGTGTIQADIAALNDLSEAQVNAQVDLALNTAIPASPTADSMNDYIQRMKFVMVNKMEITEASGNTVIYKDDDTTPYASVNAAYTSDSTTTTRLRLE
jgi:hypothetical protein